MADPTLRDVMAALSRMESRQRQHTALLNVLYIGEQIMSAEMDSLTAQVTANTTVEQSALTLIQGIAAQIQDAAGDRTKSLALAANLKSSADALQSAITANTPASP